jgi:membrane-bound lytic murein transglycosylase B|tara:strand:- start:3323 stop:4321 length:999 start_codon:yes stop_codon:yes gene_type:complete
MKKKKILIQFFILIALFGNSKIVFSEDFISFNDWLVSFQESALQKGISQETIDSSFIDIQPNKRIIELDQKQPEFTITLDEYLNNTTPKFRVNKGKKLYIKHNKLLLEVARAYNVQPRFILALWGIETSFGRYTGSFNVIESLATLSYDMRRREYFTQELINALIIIDQGHASALTMDGSWAGAMGQCQFMPSSFLNHAVDFNKDGKKDIWNTLPDVFASAANYLFSSGWNDNETWGREVTVIKKIKDDYITTSAKRVDVNKKISEWAKMGVRNLDGSNLPEVDIDAYLVYPEGVDGRKFIVYENFKTILKWNRSLFFGLAVGRLSDLIEYY